MKASAQVAGTVRTAGAGGRSDMDTTQGGGSVVRRAVIFWAIAMGVLIVMHVGGAHLDGGE